MGVPPSKVADVMALMGDSIDNIPGARDPNEKPAPGERRKPGIGEVGARQLIQQFGSAEEAIARASEVKRVELPRGARKIRRVRAAQQAARHDPHRRSRAAFARRTSDTGAGCRRASRALRRARIHVAAEGTRRSSPVRRRMTARPITRRSIRPPRCGNFSTLFRAARKPPSGSRSIPRTPTRRASERACSASKFPRNRSRAARPRTTRKIKHSLAMKDWLADAKRPKVVHDPKLFHLLAAPDSADGDRKLSLEFATPRFSIPISCGPRPRITRLPKSCCAI